MATVDITPNLKRANMLDMFDAAKNEKLVSIDTTDLVDLGASAPSGYDVVKVPSFLVLALNLGSGTKYYQIPIEFLNNVNFDGEHYYRLSSAPTVIGWFILRL